VTTAAVAVAAGAPGAAPRRGDYIGAEACGSCHERELAAWRNGPHVRAVESLRAEEAADRRCQACHTTGDAPAGRAAFANVGCEACHGAGAGYAEDDIMRDLPLSRALGLRDLSTAKARAAMCAGCHQVRTRLGAFDPERAWARIGHGAAAGAPARESNGTR